MRWRGLIGVLFVVGLWAGKADAQVHVVTVWCPQPHGGYSANTGYWYATFAYQTGTTWSAFSLLLSPMPIASNFNSTGDLHRERFYLGITGRIRTRRMHLQRRTRWRRNYLQAASRMTVRSERWNNNLSRH